MIPLSFLYPSRHEDGQDARSAPLPTLSRRDAIRIAVATAVAPLTAHADEPVPGLALDRHHPCIEIPEFRYDGTKPFTCAVTCMPLHVRGEQTLVGNHHDGGVGLRILDGYAEFLCHDGARYVRARSDARLEAGHTYRLAAVCDGQSIMLFVDDRLQRHQPRWQAKHAASDAPFFIGSDPDADGLPQHHFVGSLSDVRIATAAYVDAAQQLSLPEKARRDDQFWWRGEVGERSLIDQSLQKRHVLYTKPEF